MTQTLAKPIWSTTGNPFVDMGQEMMAALVGVNSPDEITVEDTKTLLPRLTNLLTQEGWNKSLYTVFPNSKLTNPSIKNKKGVYGELLNQWLSILASDNPEVLGTCGISGKPAQLKVARTYLPMSDSESGNFQSANEDGMPVHASVALALQFAPLGMVKIGKMIALPHFSNLQALSKWADLAKRYISETEIVIAKGIRDTGIYRPANAFFKLIENLLRYYQDIPDSSVTLYLFNNFNQVDYKAATELYYMPSKIFKFIHLAMTPSVEKEWQTIVRRAYSFAKESDSAEKILNYSNQVYERLLADKSISSFFIIRRERRPVVRGQAGWRLFSTYLKEVQGMEQRRIESLKDLGDRIAPIVRDKRKRLLRLEKAKSKGELTGILYSLTKDAAARGEDKPLITFEQLVTDIFPQEITYSDWREVQYLLLFRIYEQLFDDLKDDPTYLEEETSEENNNE
jgi:CRISPR-associated protein Cst1